MMSEEMIQYEAPQAVTLFGSNDPGAIVAAATAVAEPLAKVIKDRKLFANIKGRQHVMVEGWTLLGTMLGVFPVCTWSRSLENGLGWEARVEARTLRGEIVGAAESQCTRDESTWKTRDDFALRSMAQTRATAKALRLPLGFIMSLAGYEATPAEELGTEPSPRDMLMVGLGERLKELHEGDVDAIKRFLEDYFGDAYTGRLADLDDSELERLRKDLEEEEEHPGVVFGDSPSVPQTLPIQEPARSIEDNPLPEPQGFQITDDQRDDLIRSADRKGLDLASWLLEHSVEGPLSSVPSERASELLKEIHALPDPAQESLPVDETGWAKDEPKPAPKEKKKAGAKS